MNDPVKIAMCLPWYAGADRDCVTTFLANQHYFGRLQERMDWIAYLMDRGATDQEIEEGLASFKKLDPNNGTGWSEIPRELYGTRFDFGIGEQIGLSLVGKARERCVDMALDWGAKYVWFFDDDMLFGTDLFLRLYRAQKPVVAALAFTARNPITPVIYRFKECLIEGRPGYDIEPVMDYERDKLQKVDAVGAGVVLINTDVFKTITKPWFDSTGCGEDIHFCMRCLQHKIPVFVDTRAKTSHKPTFNEVWQTEEVYLAKRADELKVEAVA